MTTKKPTPHGTFSLRVASCRYAAVLVAAQSGLSSEADVNRAYADLERAALAHTAQTKRVA